MPTARLTDGLRVHYEERGRGTPILCVHGTGSSALVWAPAVPALARLGRVIAYDRRGCGRSERPDPYLRTSVAEHADDAAALLDVLGAGPAIVIGRSYGGAIAVDLALRHPERVGALALLEPALLSLDAGAERWSRAVAERTLAAGERGPAAAAAGFFADVLGEEDWAGLPGEVRDAMTANGPAILAELRGDPPGADPRALATIDRPVLLVAAAGSPPAFRRVNEALAGAIPHAHTALVGGNHMVDPAAPPVLAFVREIAGERLSSPAAAPAP